MPAEVPGRVVAAGDSLVGMSTRDRPGSVRKARGEPDSMSVTYPYVDRDRAIAGLGGRLRETVAPGRRWGAGLGDPRPTSPPALPDRLITSQAEPLLGMAQLPAARNWSMTLCGTRPRAETSTPLTLAHSLTAVGLTSDLLDREWPVLRARADRSLPVLRATST